MGLWKVNRVFALFVFWAIQGARLAMNLEEKLHDLFVRYLFHACRSHNGVIDKNKQVEFLLSLITLDNLGEAIPSGEYSYSVDSFRNELDGILKNRRPDELTRLNAYKHSLLRKILSDLLVRTEEDAGDRKSAYEAQRLRKQIIDLEAQIEFGKPLKDVTLIDRLTARVNVPYLVVLSLAIALIGGLAVLGLTTTMTVNVDFSVGDIIGGLLIGTGVAAAGISYATRDRKSNNAEQ